MDEKLKRHRYAWRYCQNCEIGSFAKRHVLYEFVPYQYDDTRVMFIGEGPGESEDATGRPFIGRSGMLLRSTISEVLDDIGMSGISYILTNIVACRAQDKSGGKNRPPSDEEIGNCNQRLRALLHIVNPEVVVTVGNISKKWAPIGDRKNVHLLHPAYLLRNGGKNSAEFTGFRRAIAEAFKECYEG